MYKEWNPTPEELRLAEIRWAKEKKERVEAHRKGCGCIDMCDPHICPRYGDF